MQQNRNSNRVARTIAGLILISAGLLLNEWFLAALFSADGVIAGPHAVLIRAADVFVVSLGALFVIRRNTLKKETVLLFAGIAMIAAGVLFNGRYISSLLNLDMKYTEIVIVRVINGYFIASGLIIVLFRRVIQLKSLMLAGATSILCAAAFLAVDIYRGYASFKQYQSSVSIRDTHVKDDRLGWKLKANSIGEHTQYGSFDVIYEIDGSGFKTIRNTALNPAFSIYFFGDSFTFGGGVPNKETFPNIIKDEYLREDVNVYNAAVSGYGIVQMFQRFLDLEHRIQKGDIVIFSPISDDIERNLKDFWFPYFVRFTNVLKVDDYPYFENGIVKTAPLDMGLFTTLKLLAFQAPYTQNFWRHLNKKLIPDTTAEAQDMMQRVKERAAARGGTFALFFLPTTQQCMTRRYEPDISGFDYFDIMHYFPSRKSDLHKLKLVGDKHWNPKGHQVAARAVVETLVRERLISPQFLKVKLTDSSGENVLLTSDKKD